MGDVASRTPDENVYTFYGQRIAFRGLSDFPVVIADYNRDPRLWQFPPPMRAGYVALLAATMRVAHLSDAQAGAWLSWLFSVASLALLAVIGARFLPPVAAIYAVLSLAVSLSDLAIARRCWQDAVLGGLGLTLVWAACEIARDRRGWRNYAVLIAAGSYMACVKELGALVYGACVLYVLALLWRRREWRSLAWFTGAGLAAGGLSFYCLVLAAGGVEPLLTGWQHMREAVKDNSYAWEYQNLPWYQMFRGFWILSPVNFVLAGFAMVLSVLPERRWAAWRLPYRADEVSLLRLFSWMTAAVVALLLAVPTLENFRYLAPVYGPIYLLGGIGLWALLEIAARKMGSRAYKAAAAVSVAAVLIGCVVQYQHFQQAYVVEGTPDLSLKLVLDAQK